jgi:hypothetical protein
MQRRPSERYPPGGPDGGTAAAGVISGSFFPWTCRPARALCPGAAGFPGASPSREAGRGSGPCKRLRRRLRRSPDEVTRPARVRPLRPQPSNDEAGDEGTAPLRASREGDHPRRPPAARVTRRAVLGGTGPAGRRHTASGRGRDGLAGEWRRSRRAVRASDCARSAGRSANPRGGELAGYRSGPRGRVDDTDALAEKWERLVGQHLRPAGGRSRRAPGKALLLCTLLRCDLAGNLQRAPHPEFAAARAGARTQLAQGVVGS